MLPMLISSSVPSARRPPLRSLFLPAESRPWMDGFSFSLLTRGRSLPYCPLLPFVSTLPAMSALPPMSALLSSNCASGHLPPVAPASTTPLPPAASWPTTRCESSSSPSSASSKRASALSSSSRDGRQLDTDCELRRMGPATSSNWTSSLAPRAAAAGPSNDIPADTACWAFESPIEKPCRAAPCTVEVEPVTPLGRRRGSAKTEWPAVTREGAPPCSAPSAPRLACSACSSFCT
mmetsp:Transcript_11984/g.22726  ORF Transcript_11984/g.22726 Transcript_11984/m.22726 type:complete len:235 (-) Transcript_11984:212-916(-)